MVTCLFGRRVRVGFRTAFQLGRDSLGRREVLDAVLGQNRPGEILKSGRRLFERPAREQNSGDGSGVHQVIAGPAPLVVLE